MKYQWACLVLFFGLFSCQKIYAQCVLDPVSSFTYYMPTHFTSDPPFSSLQFNERLQLYTSFSNANVTIRNSDGSLNSTLSLTQNNVVTLELTENTDENSAYTYNYNQVVSDRGFIIESDFPLNIFYTVDDFNNRSLVRLKGETVLGTSFIAASMPLQETWTFITSGGQAIEGHYVSVMASEPNTEVCFQKNNYLIEGPNDDVTAAGDINITNPLCVILPNIGDTYQIRSQTGCSDCDVNGVSVTSDKPITMNSGTVHIRAPAAGCRDGGIEQLPPVEIGGTQFAIVRGAISQDNEYFFVNALEPNTQVTVNGVVVATLANIGDTYTQIINGARGTPFWVTTDKPVQTFHVSGTAGCELGMSFVPEAEPQNCAGATSIPFSRVGNDANTISISIPTSAFGSLTYDGTAVNAGNFPTLLSNPIPGTVPPFTAISIDNADILPSGTVALFQASENFQLAVHAGNPTGGGLFSYLTNPFYNFRVDNADDPNGLDNFVFKIEDCLDVGETARFNFDVESCATGANMYSVDGEFGNISFSGDQLTYVATDAGIDNFTVTITDGNGISRDVQMQYCIGDKDNDSVQDYYDIDMDNDGICDQFECRLTNLADAKSLDEGVYTFDFGGGPFRGYVDSDGWVLWLQYHHEGGTNPNLNIITPGSNLPIFDASGLGTDNSLDLTKWGHGSQAFAASIPDANIRLRWQASTSGHDRIINFESNQGITYFQSGTGSFNGIENNFTALAGHNANIPATAVNEFSNQGDLALTNFPFWLSGNYHWGIKGNGNRWEVDDFSIGTFNTIHRVWVRSDGSPSDPFICDFDQDGINNKLDLDSDNDGIPDAIEATGDRTMILEDCSLDSNGDGTYPDYNGDGCPDGLVCFNPAGARGTQSQKKRSYESNNTIKNINKTAKKSLLVHQVIQLGSDTKTLPHHQISQNWKPLSTTLLTSFLLLSVFIRVAKNRKA